MTKEKYNSYIIDVPNIVKINIKFEDIILLNEAVHEINKVIEKVFYTD